MIITNSDYFSKYLSFKKYLHLKSPEGKVIIYEMSLPNKITCSRLALTPFIIVFFFFFRKNIALSLFLVALLSDALDGLLARERGEVTELGQALDPFADKLLYLSLFAYFSYIGKISDLAFIALLIPHLSLMLGGYMLYRKGSEIIEAKFLGKASSLILSLGLFMLFTSIPFYKPIIYAGITLAYFAAIFYFYLGVKVTQSGQPNKDQSDK